VQATKKFVLNLGMVANSSSYARGNENNAYRPDGKYYLGPGVSPGYAVFNFQAHYDLTRCLQLGVEIDNPRPAITRCKARPFLRPARREEHGLTCVSNGN